MGATYHYPEKKSTASPFVATFPATNLLVTFISENLRSPLLDLVPRLGCELEKMTSFSQKYLAG